MIPTTRYESKPKAIFWKSHIGKNFGLKRASTAKLYSGIRRFFAKHLKIGLFYLIAESMILQYCFCQQP